MTDGQIRPVLSDVTLAAVQAEATRAHLLHGESSMLNPDHTDDRRYAILGEEYGEVGRELNEASIRSVRAGEPAINARDVFTDRDRLVKELIQTAAMALTWVEALEGQN